VTILRVGNPVEEKSTAAVAAENSAPCANSNFGLKERITMVDDIDLTEVNEPKSRAPGNDKSLA
jgi:hypothetical protein